MAGPTARSDRIVPTARTRGRRRWPSRNCSTSWTGLAQVGNDTLRPRLHGAAGRRRPAATRWNRSAGRPRRAAGGRRRLSAISPAELDAWREANPRARSASCDRWTTWRPSPGRRSPSRWPSAAGCWPATWWARRPSRRPATRPPSWPPRRPSRRHHRRRRGPRQHHQRRRPPGRRAALQPPAIPLRPQRAAWLADWLERELLGETLAELRRGAELSTSNEFTAVERAIEALRVPVGSGRRLCCCSIRPEM